MKRLAVLFALLLLSAPPLRAQEPAALPNEPTTADEAADEALASDEDDSAAAQLPLEEIKRYVAVYRVVKQAYVDSVGDRELMQAAIRGLLLDLDPHSAYLDKDDVEALNELSSGAYDGVGLELVQRPDRSLMVVAPIDDTPAARAGIRAGDIITAINGEPIDADSVDRAVSGLRGEPGTTVKLTILREGEVAPREFTLTREIIRVTSVRGRLLEPGYGYLRISTFQIETGPEVGKQLQALAAQSGGRLKGLVLDLRSNPGGLLNAAVEAADDFLDEGVIVSTKGRLAFSDSEYRATPGDKLAGAPIVVLMDAGSASAAEVLAGALHDHQRALLMGSRTFGKGSVQTVLPLDNGDSIKLTTARYFTPSGKSIQARGISPDVVLHPADGDGANGLRESDLPGHLRGDEEASEGYAQGEVLEGDDYIEQALLRLKAMVENKPAPAAKPARTTAATSSRARRS